MATFTIKRNDREPYIQVTLVDGSGVAVNLTTAIAVKFIMRAGLGTPKVNAAATVVTPASGIVRYSWGATDTNTAGTYHCEWEVEWSAGVKQTFPSAGYDTVLIVPDLG